jgi:ATP-binding cassette subfamily C protein LapB
MSSATLTAPAMFGKARAAGAPHPLLDIFRSPDLRRMLPGLVIVAALYNVIALALPMAILQIIDRVLANQSIETLVFIVLGVLLGLAVEEFLRAINTYVTGWLGARFEHSASIAALDRLMHVPPRHLKKDEPVIHCERIAGASRVAEFYSGQALLVVLDLPFALLFILAIYVIGGWVAIVPVALMAIFAMVIWRFGELIRRQVGERQIHEERRFNFLREVFAGIHSVKTLAMEPQMERRHESLLEGNTKVNESLYYASAMASGAGMLFSQVMVVTVVFAAAWAVVSGEMTPGGLAACMMLSVRAMQPLRRSFAIWLRYQTFLTAHARLMEIAQMPWIDDDRKPPLAPVREGIELRQITLGYGAGGALFSNLNFRMNAGECIAIRGDSGSGKTTLLALMNGVEQPDSGSVLVDGLSIADFNSDSVQREIAMLGQTGTIFTGTVMENLTMFEPGLKDSVLDISRRVGLDSVVSKMRLGYQTPLGEGNIETLPSGVRQMISIVRALANNPSVILFDEANISLDMEADGLLREYLASRKGQCMIVLVTHRPSLLSLADRSVHLSSGILSEASPLPPRLAATAARQGQAPADERPPASDDLAEMVRQQFTNETDFSRCLIPMLRTLQWQGSGRELAEALPRLINTLDLTSYCSVMANLGLLPRRVRARLDRLDPRLIPCLFVPEQRAAQVVMERLDDGRMRCFDGLTEIESEIEPDAELGEIFLFKPAEKTDTGAAQGGGFFSTLALRFRQHLVLIMFLTACATLLALAPPLFVMAIYDHVLPTGDIIIQSYLLFGVGIVLVLDYLLRRLRSRVTSFVAGRAEYIVGTTIFNRVLSLPSSATETVSVNRQVGRMRSFESLRDFFLGPLSVLAFDFPASLILLAALGYFNPIGVAVVLAGTAIFALLWFATRGPGERRVAQTSRVIALRRELLDETVAQLSVIRSSGKRAVWLQRYRELCGKAVTANFNEQQYQARVSAAAQALGTATGLVALGVSAYAAIQGSITGGAMIATTMIVWRLTGPMQNFFLAASAVVKIRVSMQQIENLMRLPSESTGRARAEATPTARSAIDFARVSFRYANDADPALLGISITVAPGEVIVVTGPNGSGKSTMLKMMTRAFSPQAGTIRFDGMDIRQLTVADLRLRISYMPQNCDIFYGTVTQNLQLAHPSASQDEIEWAVRMVGLTEEITALPEGYNTRLSNNQSDQLPHGFRQRLALARTLLKPASVVLLDEPGTGLDSEGELALQVCIEWLRKRSTLIIASHRPGHMRMADNVLYMERGSIVATGSYEKIKPRLMAGVRR